MAALVSAVASDLTRIVATFDVTMDPTSLLPHLWSLYPTGPAAAGAIIKATVNANLTTVDLVISPRLSANGTYDISADSAVRANGTAIGPNDKSTTFVVPNGAANPAQSGFPRKLREAFLEAAAEEMQYLVGRPTTMLVAEFPVDAIVVLVESTLGFPLAGTFWIEDNKYTYTSTTPASFKGVVATFPTNGQRYYPRELLFLDIGSVGAMP